MLTVISTALAILFVFVFKKAIRRAPWVFYVLAIAVDAFVLVSPQLDLPVWVRETVVLANVRCLFAFGLLIIVMYTGVLRDGSRLKHWLLPIRSELSIIATILAASHVVRYLGVYSPRVLSSPVAMENGIVLSFCVAVVLTCLFVVLGVTSFGLVKRAMGARRWKLIQRLAYPFFALVYVHVLLVLARSALSGGTSARVSVVLYGCILVVYAILRIRRFLEDRRARPTAAQPRDNQPAMPAS